MGVFKMDWALSGPIPWKAEACLSGTVHLGGTLAEIAQSERSLERRTSGEAVRLARAADALRSHAAPPGQHVAWGYCHVPHGSTVDMSGHRRRSGTLRTRLPRSDPARHTMNTRHGKLQRELRGGEINGGVQDLWQPFATGAEWNPHDGGEGWFLVVVHATGRRSAWVCGYFAARAAMRYLKRRAGLRSARALDISKTLTSFEEASGCVAPRGLARSGS